MKLSFNDLKPDTHYWLHNKSYDGRDIWRTVYVIMDSDYAYATPKMLEKRILLTGCQERYRLSYFESWDDVFFIEIPQPSL
jgi:hypothetical protein